MRSSVEFIILLLQVIKHNGNVNYLVLNGYSYAQIFENIERLTKKGYTTQVDDKIILSPKGDEYLAYLNKRLKRVGIYRYISPEINYKRKKMKIDEIYIPLQNKRE